MVKYRITTDIFTLPLQEDKLILYAPLVGFACAANNDLITLLADLENIDDRLLTPDQMQTIHFLIKRGIINGRASELSCKTSNGDLSPSKLTLFPTDRCNSRCRYCYASSATRAKKIMAWPVAAGAIEYFIDLLKTEERKHFTLELHGGGEPFQAWNLVKKIIKHAENRCEREKVELEVCAGTNGVLSENQIRWIVSHITSLNISFEGLPHIQDYHRPLKNGGSSFLIVDRTLKYLDQHQYPYGIRCTVSNHNENLLDETVDFIMQNYRSRLIFLEPVYVCGRYGNSDEIKPPDLDKFVEKFQYLQTRCIERGIRLEYSGAIFERKVRNFCYVGTDDFAVTPDGYLTNCWEVTGPEHPLAETFLIGRILPGGKIKLDHDKVDYLRSLSVENLDYCRDCFAKYHCAGDCVTRLGHTNFNGPRGGARCRTNRQLIANRIVQMMERENFYQSI